MTAEENYKYGLKTYCRRCEYCKYNPNAWYVIIDYINPVTKKKRRSTLRKNSFYCFHISMCDEKGKPKKINGNHIRWWGVTPLCPFNIYKHTCEGCGQRMATDETMCSSCKKYRNLNERGML